MRYDDEKPSASLRMQVALLRVLSWSNGLEAWLSLMALCWSMSILFFPSFLLKAWRDDTAWPITPLHLCYVLAISGAAGMLGLRNHSRWLRMQTSVIGFMCWGLLAVYDVIVPPLPLAQACTIHSLFALAELSVYMRVLIGFDKRENQLERMVARPHHHPTDEDA